MKFGEKVKEQRNKAGLLQADVANAIGVTKRTLANYEGGTSYPQDRSVYIKLAEFFKVDVNYFLTEDEEFLTLAKKATAREDKPKLMLYWSKPPPSLPEANYPKQTNLHFFTICKPCF